MAAVLGHGQNAHNDGDDTSKSPEDGKSLEWV